MGGAMDIWAKGAVQAQSRVEAFEDESRIYFAKGTYQELNLKEIAKVDRLADMINADSNVYVSMVGRTSGDGEAKDPIKLSYNRALKVRALFLAKNVDEYKLLGGDGLGSADPLAYEGGSKEAVAEARRKNRSVQVILRGVPEDRPNIDVLEAARRVQTPPQPPPGSPYFPCPVIPKPPASWEGWSKFKPEQRKAEWGAFKERVEEWAEKAHVDPKFYLGQLKDILFPSDTEGPLDPDFHKDQGPRPIPGPRLDKD